jgi:hypothetical protein
VYILAQPSNTSFASGKLPGVSFRTSRWRKPEGMFAGLGLTVDSPMPPPPEAVMTGDLAITTTAIPGGAVVEGNDQAYQNALDALGLDGWPVTIVPRLSRMWIEDSAGSWLFAGLMIESPEPIHRPGRLELNSLTLDMGPAGSGITFGIRRRDRSGSRLIYLTERPFHVAPPVQTRLVLRATSTRAPANVAGRLKVPPAPGFAGDP